MQKYFIYFLIVLCLIEIIPFIITLISPKLSYGSTKIGKFHQELNARIHFSYINWIAYCILVFLLIYTTNRKIKNYIIQNLFILIGLFLIYLPVYPFLNIFNLFLQVLYSNPPIIKNYYDTFPQSKNIENSADIIIKEFNAYDTSVECIRDSNPGFVIETTSDDEKCWRGLFLKKYGKIVDGVVNDKFPNTIELLKDDQIHNAFFSILDPGVEIPPHTGYYKGYLRYHLGVKIPNGNEKTYIVCGGEKYIWKEKEGVLFDDMYLHYVKNPTKQQRVVLYLDVKRKSDNKIVNFINDLGISLVENSPVLKMFLKNQHTQKEINV